MSINKSSETFEMGSETYRDSKTLSELIRYLLMCTFSVKNICLLEYDARSLHQWYSTFFCSSALIVSSLQLCTSKFVVYIQVTHSI
jgi:hypothetical protein